MKEIEINGNKHRFEEAETFLDKLRGMRFRKEGKMFFRLGKTVNLVDMFFVPVPLQLIFVDSGGEILEVKEAKPWRIYISPVEASFMLESTDFIEVEEGETVEFEI